MPKPRCAAARDSPFSNLGEQCEKGTFVTFETVLRPLEPCPWRAPQVTIIYLVEKLALERLESPLRKVLFTLSRLLWGAYLVLTSLYCLLAFLPYTYFALIKAPPYEWMPWFAHHQGILYFAVLLPVAALDFWTGRRWANSVLFGVLAIVGVYLCARPFLVNLQSDQAAYRWSLVALAPLALVAAMDIFGHWPGETRATRQAPLFAYSTALVVALCAALLYALGTELHNYSDKRTLILDSGRLEITLWSVISHALLAIIVLSVVNLICLASWRTRRPRAVNFALVGLAVFVALWIVLARFLDAALSFSGMPALAYAGGLAFSLTLFGASLVLPYLSARARAAKKRKLVPLFIVTGISIAAVALPTVIAGGDWNGVLEATFTVMFWIVLSICFYLLWPQRRSYSLVNLLAVLLLSGFAYKSLQATEIFWAKPLGPTDDDVSIAMETYAAQDVSFQLAHHILGNARHQPCDDLCRILREHTNIRDAQARFDVELVDSLQPTRSHRPNIFILVIDSMRPDYLGAYNPKVDFTPNLDAFARDGIAVHNAYTQYAGTTLSEPTIWSGMLLLHAHYLQPFSKVNSLEKLANTDGYQMVVSYDSVLSQILSPQDDLIKLDTDKPLWNRFEVCSTLRQTEGVLDARRSSSRPVLFYAQPMNVHQFAHNDLPMISQDNWQIRPGFDNRIAHEVHQVDGCLGDFFGFLKSRGLYQDSIIIITSDHGDATGEFGRHSHSLSIYPEIMRVPLLVHLPTDMRRKITYDDAHLSALTDVTPSLYYLLGHRPLRSNPLFGHPLFVETPGELKQYQRDELFLASDERAVYGLLMDNGELLFTTYDSPAQSFLFDLTRDPNALHNILNDTLKRRYDEQLIERLQAIADFYGYKPGVGSLLAAAH